MHDGTEPVVFWHDGSENVLKLEDSDPDLDQQTWLGYLLFTSDRHKNIKMFKKKKTNKKKTNFSDEISISHKSCQKLAFVIHFLDFSHI